MTGGEGRSLDGIALLQSLSEQERSRVVESCSWRRFGTGEQIFDREDLECILEATTDAELTRCLYG